MATRRSIKNDVEQLRERTQTDDQGGILTCYEHPRTGELYDRYKTVVDDPEGIIIHYSWHCAPFIVEREKAKAEGWNIVASYLGPDYPTGYDDLVEVSEWCINPWVDNPDDREVVSEE